MDITRENINELNAVISLKLEQNDYQSKIDKVLRDYRKKARIDGFRVGMVPSGMIKKMYGTQVLLDEVNKLVSEELPKYLFEQKLNLLGEPLPSEKQQPIDFENQTEFEFLFDIALAPEIKVVLTKKDKYVFYDIIVDDEILNRQIEAYANQYGKLIQVDVIDEKSTIKGQIYQVDSEEKTVAEGIALDSVMLSIDMMKDEKIIKDFIGANKDQIITFNPKTAFQSDVEVSSLLKITKEEAKLLDSNFQIIIKEITNYYPSEIDQSLFDKVYPTGTVTTEEEFKIKIKEDIKKSFHSQSEFRFGIDAKEKLTSKIPVELPDEFLKRWLLAKNKNTTIEQIENEFDNFKKDLHWQLIRNSIIKENNITVSEEELLSHAKAVTRAQLQQYGMSNLSDEQIESFAKMTMTKDEDKQRLNEGVYEQKTFEYIRESVKLDVKEISTQGFNELFK